MDKFLESCKLQKLMQEVMETQNNTGALRVTKFMTKNSPPNKFPNLHGFTGEDYQTFQKKIIPLLQKRFQKVVELGTPPNSFKEASVILLIIRKHKTTDDIPCRCKMFLKILENQIQ